MPESVLACAIGLVLLAATTHRFRREAGQPGARAKQVLRSAAAVLIVGALIHCGTAVPGERWVRLLGCASVAAAAVVLLLSFVPSHVLAPVRAMARRTHTDAPTR